MSPVTRRTYDVFLSYNSKDRASVRLVAETLRAMGIQPWFDEWDIQVGLNWREVLERIIKDIKTAIIFLGKHGESGWQRLEINALIQENVNRDCRIIPIILPNVGRRYRLPPFLNSFESVDLRKDNPHAN